MKRRIILALCCALVLSSCASKSEYLPLEEIPEAYTLEDAEEDGCVIFTDGDISSGQTAWDEFCEMAYSGKSDGIRLVFYYTLGDPSRYDSEYYESIKDDYPKMYIQDLSFDGEEYTLRWFEESEIVKTYRYLMRYEGEPSSEGALFDRYVRYVLVNDNTVTWEDIEHGMFSAVFDDYVEHSTVYIDIQ